MSSSMSDRRWALEKALHTMSQHHTFIEATSFDELITIVLTTAARYSNGLDDNYQSSAPTPK